MWLLAIFHDLRDCCNHVDVVHRISNGTCSLRQRSLRRLSNRHISQRRAVTWALLVSLVFSLQAYRLQMRMSQQEWMVAECQPVTPVRLLGLAALDRSFEVDSQSSRPPVAEVTSRAPRQQDSPRLSQLLIYLSNLLQQVSEGGSRYAHGVVDGGAFHTGSLIVMAAL